MPLKPKSNAIESKSGIPDYLEDKPVQKEIRMPVNKASKIVSTKGRLNSEEVQIENHFENLTSIEESMQKLDFMLSGKENSSSKTNYRSNMREARGNNENLNSEREEYFQNLEEVSNLAKESLDFQDQKSNINIYHQFEAEKEPFSDKKLNEYYDHQEQLSKDEINHNSANQFEHLIDKDYQYLADGDCFESETKKENYLSPDHSNKYKEYLWSDREEEIDYDNAAKELQADLERLQKYQYKSNEDFIEEEPQDVRIVIPKKTSINIDKIPINREVQQKDEEEDQFAKLKALMARTRQDIEAFSSKIDDSN